MPRTVGLEKKIQVRYHREQANEEDYSHEFLGFGFEGGQADNVAEDTDRDSSTSARLRLRANKVPSKDPTRNRICYYNLVHSKNISMTHQILRTRALNYLVLAVACEDV